MAIQVLDELTIRRIAAGEVVDRPASLVKELVENALDAGASSVRVALAEGGRARVRVTDDGVGMDAADAECCLERHATSKIQRLEDLFTTATLGFRGEALPSIASVTRFSLVTRTAAQELGTRIEVEDGLKRVVGPVAARVGTDIDCRSLFYAVPARRKFLRTESTELSHCVEVVVRLSLAHPAVGFEVRHEGRPMLRAPAGQTRAERARSVLGPQARSLLPVDYQRAGVRVHGLAAPAGVHVSSARKALYCYVNNRYVADRLVRKGVLEAYRAWVPRGRYPLVVLDVQVPPEKVDVNVHPHKTEVRFADGRAVVEALESGLREALSSHGVRRTLAAHRSRPVERDQLVLGEPQAPLPAHPDDDPSAPAPTVPPAPAPDDAWLPTERPPLAGDGSATTLPWLTGATAAAPPPLPASEVHEPVRAVPVEAMRRWTPLGALGSLWVGAAEDALVVVDPAAVAQRLALVRWNEPVRKLVPDTVPVDAAVLEVLLHGRARLAEVGVELTGSGPVALAVLPAPLAGIPGEQLLLGAARALQATHEQASLRVALAALAPPPAADPLEMRTALATLAEHPLEASGLLPLQLSLGADELWRRLEQA